MVLYRIIRKHQKIRTSKYFFILIGTDIIGYDIYLGRPVLADPLKKLSSKLRLPSTSSVQRHGETNVPVDQLFNRVWEQTVTFTNIQMPESNKMGTVSIIIFISCYLNYIGSGRYPN